MRRESAAGPLSDYQVGQRVQTKEGFPGTVKDVLEGPSDLTTLWVSLDNGKGGGEYAEGEVWPLEQRGAQLATVEHVASDDYPELGSILHDRLPPALRTVGSKQAANLPQEVCPASYSQTSYPRDESVPTPCFACGHPVLLVILPPGHDAMVPGHLWRDGSPWSSDEGNKEANKVAQHLARVVPPFSGSTTVEAVMVPALSDAAILDQFTQYPQTGPEGISYFRGDINAEWHVDCLLYRKGGKLVGVLNCFPQDMGPEKKGNVNVLVHPDYRRQGIGAALWAEAKKRWNVHARGQETTPEGKAFLTHEGLYLPPKPPSEQGAKTAPVTDRQRPGYQDGFAHGQEGITRAPANPTDPDYMQGYDIGWSEGVTVYREPANSWDQDDLAADQTAGIGIDPIGPMSAAKSEWHRHPEGYGYVSHDGEFYLERGGIMTHGGPAWIVHRRTPEDKIGRDTGSPYHKDDGSSLTEVNGTLYHYLGDEPYLSDAKAAVDHHRKQGSHTGQVVIEAGSLWDFVKGTPKPDADWKSTTEYHSFDWCRFRRMSHCWLPKDLDEEASKQAGYAVWNPVDRGYCPRIRWEDQENCPTGEPGPRVPGGLTDATTSWEEGGQHGGTPSNIPGVIPGGGTGIVPPMAARHSEAGLDDVAHEVPGIVRDYAMTPIGDEPYAAEMDDISRAYRDLPILDPNAVALWVELGELCLRQAEVLKGMYHVIRLDDSDPYMTADEMYRDVDCGIYKVTSLHSHHPVWTPDVNVAFRIVHDLTGHTTSHSDFSLRGEVIAYQNQCAQTPEHLWSALFTEIVAQSAYANVHHLFGEQKVGVINLTKEEIAEHVGRIMDAPDPVWDPLHMSATMTYRAGHATEGQDAGAGTGAGPERGASAGRLLGQRADLSGSRLGGLPHQLAESCAEEALPLMGFEAVQNRRGLPGGVDGLQGADPRGLGDTPSLWTGAMRAVGSSGGYEPTRPPGAPRRDAKHPAHPDDLHRWASLERANRESGPEDGSMVLPTLQHREGSAVPQEAQDHSLTVEAAYYHGSPHNFQAGDLVLPASEIGVEPHSHPDVTPEEFDNGSWVYMADSTEGAEMFASDHVGQPHVYEVQPIGEVEDDPENELFGVSGGVRAPRARVVRKVSSTRGLTAEAAFEKVAAWKDIQAKAKRLRAEGGVRIVSVNDNIVSAVVKGDHGQYETELVRNPGRRNTASWACGCKWSSYSWGRSGPWKRYEGRMCSHALALQYEAQSGSMFGRDLEPHTRQPAWMDQSQVKHPGDYNKDTGRYSALAAKQMSARTIDQGDVITHQGKRYTVKSVERTSKVIRVTATNGATIYLQPDETVGLVEPGSRYSALAAKGDGVDTCKHCGSDDLWSNFYDKDGFGTSSDADGAKWDTLCQQCGKFQNRRNRKPKTAAKTKRFWGKVRGLVRDLFIGDDGHVYDLHDKQHIPHQEVLYPGWDPHLGLSLSDTGHHVGSTTATIPGTPFTHLDGEQPGDTEEWVQDPLYVTFDWVHPQIAVGGALLYPSNVLQLREQGVVGIISGRDDFLDETLALGEDVGVSFLSDPTHDDGGPKPTAWFASAIDFALPILQAGGKVYCHCYQGVNRGPSLAYAVLRAFTGMSPGEAFSAIIEARPFAWIDYADDADRALRDLGYQDRLPSLASKQAGEAPRTESVQHILDLAAIEATVASLRGSSGQLGICGRATQVIEQRFGYPKVEGFYEGPDATGRQVWIPHAWNQLPGGDVLDATADQFGFSMVRVVPQAQASAYKPFTPEQTQARQDFREEEGHDPGPQDWPFLMMEGSRTATRGAKNDFQVEFRHPHQEKSTKGSYENPDTAIKWARGAHAAGAEIARVTRKSDGKVIWDGPAGIGEDWYDHDNRHGAKKHHHKACRHCHGWGYILGGWCPSCQGHGCDSPGEHTDPAPATTGPAPAADTTTASQPKEGSMDLNPDEFGSLWEIAADPVGLAPVQAAFGDDPSYEWFPFEFAGVNDPMPDERLDDDPDAALPVTYGEDDDAPLHAEASAVAARLAATLGGSGLGAAAPGPARPRAVRGQAQTPVLEVLSAPESPEQKGARLLAQHEARLRGEAVPGPDPFAHLGAGGSDNEMAAAAQQFLAKQALKTYTPAERKNIIDEGEGVTASNLDRLDIRGTHYEALAAATARAAAEDEDLTFLSGDPNLGDF